MKNLFYSLCIVISVAFLTWNNPVFAETETKKVCIDMKKDGKDVKDTKTGKTKQICKDVKRHKKLDGTRVPDKKVT